MLAGAQLGAATDTEWQGGEPGRREPCGGREEKRWQSDRGQRRREEERRRWRGFGDIPQYDKLHLDKSKE